MELDRPQWLADLRRGFKRHPARTALERRAGRHGRDVPEPGRGGPQVAERDALGAPGPKGLRALKSCVSAGWAVTRQLVATSHLIAY